MTGGSACINGTIKACARAGRLEEGQQIMREAIKQGIYLSSGSFDALIFAASRAGRPDIGMNLLQLMKKANVEITEIT